MMDAKMVVLQQKKAKAIQSHKYVEASRLSALIKEVEERTINTYLSNYGGQTERMDNLMKDMPDEDRELLNVYTNAIIFLCDMIESLSIDSDQILKKHHPEYRIEMFDKISQIGKEAKAHVKFMSENTNMVYQVSFADGADDISELLLNKVKAFIKKLRRKEKRKQTKK